MAQQWQTRGYDNAAAEIPCVISAIKVDRLCPGLRARGRRMALPEKMKKKEVAVNIVLVDGTTFEGCVFAAEGQRLLDLMNDHRAYIPYTEADGNFTIIQKLTIARIIPN